MSTKSIISSLRFKIARSTLLPSPIKKIAKATYYFLIPSQYRESNILYHTMKALDSDSNRKFLQIGASDGIKDDPLYPFSSKTKWTGVMVEPNPVSFTNLQKNHHKTPSEIEFVNVAIGEAGTFSLYWCKEDPGMGSTDYEMSKCSAESRGFELQQSDVQMLPFTTFIEKYPTVKDVDLLLVDTEGWDCDIIQSIDFENFTSEVVVYEAVHTAEEKQKEAWEYLESNGYKCFTSKDDVVAIKRKSNRKLLKKILINGGKL